MKHTRTHIVVGGWVGGFLLGGATFLLSCHILGVNPLQTTGKEIQETIGTAGHFKILVPSVVALVFGMFLGANVAAAIWVKRGQDVGWLSGLVRRLKMAHAQGMDNVAMMAVKRCMQRFPEVFTTRPWDAVPSNSLQRLHGDKEYRLAVSGLQSAFDAIHSAGDKTNAAIAVLEKAKVLNRARDWEKADASTEAAVLFCKELHSRDACNIQFTEFYADALLWRGFFLAFGRNEKAQSLQLLDAARKLYTDVGSHEGVVVIDNMKSMGILCDIGGHHWRECQCSRCGASRGHELGVWKETGDSRSAICTRCGIEIHMSLKECAVCGGTGDDMSQNQFNNNWSSGGCPGCMGVGKQWIEV